MHRWKCDVCNWCTEVSGLALYPILSGKKIFEFVFHNQGEHNFLYFWHCWLFFVCVCLIKRKLYTFPCLNDCLKLQHSVVESEINCWTTRWRKYIVYWVTHNYIHEPKGLNISGKSKFAFNKNSITVKLQWAISAKFYINPMCIYRVNSFKT